MRTGTGTNRRTIQEVFKRCTDNGHKMVEDDPSVPHVIGYVAHCSKCTAILRFYKSIFMGEANQTTCPVRETAGA